MLFQFIDRALDVLADTVQYGPFEAARINTSICPEAERSYKEVNGKVQQAINDAYRKFEQSANVSEEYKQTEEYKKKTPVTADQFTGMLMKETAEFMSNWLNDLYKDNSTDGKMPTPEPQQAPVIYKLTDKEVEIISKTFTEKDVYDNISAAISHFQVEDPIDVSILKGTIAASIYVSGILPADICMKICEKKQDKAILVSLVKIYNNEVLDKNVKRLPLAYFKDADMIDDLIDITKWESEYLKELKEKKDLQKFYDGYKDILKCLDDIKKQISEPIITVEPGQVSSPKKGFSKEEKDKIKEKIYNAFKEALDAVPHYAINILPNADMAEIVVSDDQLQKFNALRVDPNTILGNGYNLIITVDNGAGVPMNLYINSRRKDICKHVIAPEPTYKLTLADIQNCLSDKFVNDAIYYFIDMPSFGSSINKLKEPDKSKVGKKLGAVANVLYIDNGAPRCRMRMSRWNGINDFELISDAECRCPMSADNITCPTIEPEAKISVKDDMITVEYQRGGQPVKDLYEIKY